MFMESKKLHTVNRTGVGIHPSFETYGRRHHKSKTRVSVAKQKGLMSSNFFLKNILIIQSWQISYPVNIINIVLFAKSSNETTGNKEQKQGIHPGFET